MNANIGRTNHKIGRPLHSTLERLPLNRKLHQDFIYYVGRSDTRERVKDKIIFAATILHHSGMRASELLKLKYQHLSDAVFEGRFSLDNSTKTKSTRLILLARLGRKEIEELIDGYEGDMKDYVFPAKNGGALSKGPFIRLLNRHIHSILGELYSSHSYRISYITDLLKVSSANLAQKAVGHKSVSTTLRYGYSSTEDILSKLEETRGQVEAIGA